jgi:hypothetical protein
MPELRRPVIRSATAAAGVCAGLALMFFVVLSPGRPSGCQPGLYAGLYGDLVTPLHVVAFAVTSAALLALARALGRERATAVVIGLAAAYVVVSLIHPPLFGFYGLAALILLLPVTASLAITIGVLALDARRQPSAELRWERRARATWIGLWVTLLVLLPGQYALAWANGSGGFCF